MKWTRFVAILLTGHLVACTTYVRRNGDPATIVASEELPRVKLRSHGKDLVVHFPRVLADSLVGFRAERRDRGRLERGRIAIHLEDIDAISTERWDGVESALVAATSVTGYVFFIWWGQRLGN